MEISDYTNLEFYDLVENVFNSKDKQRIDIFTDDIIQQIRIENKRMEIETSYHSNKLIKRTDEKSIRETEQFLIEIEKRKNKLAYFQEIITNKASQPTIHTKKKKQPKPFKDYLLCKDKIEEVMSFLHKVLDNNTSGKHIATIKDALVEKGYLLKHARVTPILIKEFNIGCAPQSINGYVTISSEVEAMKNNIP